MRTRFLKAVQGSRKPIRVGIVASLGCMLAAALVLVAVFAAMTGECKAGAFEFQVNAGGEYYTWKPGYQAAEKGSNLLKFETEGAALYRFQGNVTYLGRSVLNLGLERPLSATKTQKELVRATTEREAGLEEFTYGITLDPFVEMLFPGDSLPAKIAERLLSLRFRQTVWSFVGSATAVKDMVYLPADTAINYQTDSVTGGEAFSEGQLLNFKTQYTEKEFSIPIWVDMTTVTRNGKVVEEVSTLTRIGYYSAEWDRPTATNAITVNSMPVVYDANYRSEGLMVSFENADPGSAGFNCDFVLRWGIRSSINSPIDWENAITVGEDKHLNINSAGIDLAIWYNYYPKRIDGLCITAGLAGRIRALNVDINSNAKDSNGDVQTTRIVHDTDAFTKATVAVSYRF